jgi:septation ring formation regulator EzrA
MVGYINLGILLVTLGFVIGVYVHTDKKIDKLSDEIREVDNKLSAIIERLSDRIDKLSDRMDRIYDILVHMGFRDKAANE